MKTEQPITCPYCGHMYYRDFTDSDACAPQIEQCSKCHKHFAVRLQVSYSLQTCVLFDAQEPNSPYKPEPRRSKTEVAAVRFLLTDQQREALAPFVALARAARTADEITVTIGQLDACDLDRGYVSAWFAMLAGNESRRMAAAVAPIWRDLRPDWLVDETGADFEVIVFDDEVQP